MAPRWPVPVRCEGDLAGGTIVWRRRGELRVTVVVKVTYALDGDTLVRVASEPICRTDEPFFGDPAWPVRVPTDVVPVAPRAEIVVAADRRGQAGTWARLSVLRGAKVVLDKRAQLTEGPVAELAAMAATSPARQSLLHGAAPIDLAGALVTVGDDVSLAYFQCAPADQRLDALHGDERIVLEQLHGHRAHLELALPRDVVLATASVSGRALEVSLAPDLVAIDAERERCSVTWRGSFVAATAQDVVGMSVEVRLAPSGAPWPARPRVAEAPAPPRGARPPPPRRRALPAPEPRFAEAMVPGDSATARDEAMPFASTSSLPPRPAFEPETGGSDDPHHARLTEPSPLPDEEGFGESTMVPRAAPRSVRAPFAISASSSSHPPSPPVPGAPWAGEADPVIEPDPEIGETMTAFRWDKPPPEIKVAPRATVPTPPAYEPPAVEPAPTAPAPAAPAPAPAPKPLAPTASTTAEPSTPAAPPSPVPPPVTAWASGADGSAPLEAQPRVPRRKPQIDVRAAVYRRFSG